MRCVSAALALIVGLAAGGVATQLSASATVSSSVPAPTHWNGQPHSGRDARSKKALGTYVVTTSDISGLGVVLVDGKGQALYVFGPDAHSGTSSCYSACAIEWPPLLLPKGVTRPRAAGRAKVSLLGTTRRSDGTTQVTYKGWPLYRFATDESPGSAPGEGLDNLGGHWYVLSPKGSEIR